jgi:hypothetical protein
VKQYIEDAGEILWGSSVSKGTVSNLNQKAFARVEEWRARPLTCAYPYACVDGTCLKRNWGGAYGSVAMLIATGVNEDGCREAIGCAEGCTESAGSWREFLLSLRERGLRGVGMVTGDESAGMMGALAEIFPEAPCQRCAVHFHRNALSKVPARRRKRVAAQPKAIHAQESLGAGLRKAEEVARELETSRLADAAKVIRGGVGETLAYARFPMGHWRRVRTNNGIEMLDREVKRRANAVGGLPDGRPAMMLAAARREYVADGTWGERRCLDISLLDHWDERSVSTEWLCHTKSCRHKGSEDICERCLTEPGARRGLLRATRTIRRTPPTRGRAPSTSRRAAPVSRPARPCTAPIVASASQRNHTACGVGGREEQSVLPTRSFRGPKNNGRPDAEGSDRHAERQKHRNQRNRANIRKHFESGDYYAHLLGELAKTSG